MPHLVQAIIEDQEGIKLWESVSYVLVDHASTPLLGSCTQRVVNMVFFRRPVLAPERVGLAGGFGSSYHFLLLPPVGL